MTKEEIQKMIDDSIENSKERIWHYWHEINTEANWAYNPLMALYKAGLFKGASSSDLKLSQTKMECLVIIARSFKMQGVIDYEE